MVITDNLVGRLEHIPVLDRELKEKRIRGILVGGLARVYHISKRNQEQANEMLPRKDTDIVLIDGDENIEIQNVDTHRRFNYDLDWNISDPRRSWRQFPYWSNRNGAILDVTFPNIDDILSSLPPGLYVPDNVFLERMFARWHNVRDVYTHYHERLPDYLKDADPLLDRRLIKAKFRRLFRGDPEGVISMDGVIVRPLTNFEKYCLIHHRSSFPKRWSWVR